MAKSTVGVLSLRVLQDAIVKTLEQINVDIVEFVACHFLVSHSIPNNLLLGHISIYLTVSIIWPILKHFAVKTKGNTSGIDPNSNLCCENHFPLEPIFTYSTALLLYCASSTAVRVFISRRKSVYELPCEGVQATFEVFGTIARH